MGQLATIPQEVPATNAARLDIETRGLQSEALYKQAAKSPNLAFNRAGFSFLAASGAAAATQLGTQESLSKALRDKALAEVDARLEEEGLLDAKTKQVSKQAQEEFGYERQTSLPTAGVIVKSCLDDCGICEPEVSKRTQLELERLHLQNQLLKRQIELLDKSQEYRCCPQAETDEDEK